MINKRIYLKDWLKLKPYKKQSETDIYYLNICNDVKKIITNNKYSFVLKRYLNDEDIKLLSSFLTSYFEDLISETNIWNSYIKLHKRLYNKPLPFYNCDEYYEKEINYQDISFLIWYYLNTIQDEIFISPFNDFIIHSSENIYNVFEKEWEYAPENGFLKTFYQINQEEDEYYIARKLIDNVLFKTYLFYTDTHFKLLKTENEIIEKTQDKDYIKMYLTESRDNLLHQSYTQLLSINGKEWVAEILGSNHLLSKEFINLSKKIEGLFLYKGQDNFNIFIEHIASRKMFNLTKKSFEYSDDLNELDTIIFIGIIQWKNEWWFSGIFYQQPFNPDIILDEKNSFQSRIEVNFLDKENNKIHDTLKKQLNAFKVFNNGFQIAFLPSDKINEYIDEFVQFFNNSLNLNEKEIREAKQRAINDGYFGSMKHVKDFSSVSDTGLIFFNPNSGIEIALSINSAFPMLSNPYYKKEESEEHLMVLLMNKSLSKELAIYCINNCVTKLSFFKDSVGKKYLENIDFLLRFWKSKNYHTTPQIAITGSTN